MKQKHYYILLIILQFAVLPKSFSQTASFQKYKVVSLPKTAYNIDTLNKELSKANSKSDVARILKSHKQLFSVPIIIRVKKSDTELSWWRINAGEIEKEGDFAILQSKASDANNFYTINELRKYFRDTVVCFDTLRIGAYLQNEDFRTEDYFMVVNENNNVTKIALPFDMRNNLLFTSSIFNNNSLVSGALYNKADTTQPITNCVLYFLNESAKASLIEIAKDLKQEMPNADIKTLAGYLNNYIKSNYGVASYSDVIRFLSLNQ